MKKIAAIIVFLQFMGLVYGDEVTAKELDMGEEAPKFSLKNQDGQEFKLESREGHWTVLYFYPKADTPGCTKQACAFRDNIDKIRALGAEVYGISVNTVKDQSLFHKKYGLKFDLLADEAGQVTRLYGAKMPILTIAKRWTFLIDPKLRIRSIDKTVDPVKDPSHVVEKLMALQKN